MRAKFEFLNNQEKYKNIKKKKRKTILRTFELVPKKVKAIKKCTKE